MSYEFDIVVIGAGPGGYVAAIRASQLGLKVAIIEKNKNLGGTCLNVGCIPTKALLDSSEHYEKARTELGHFGISFEKLSFDLSVMMDRKNKVVEEVCAGVDFLMKKNKIQRFYGSGSLLDSHTVKIDLAENGGSQEVSTEKIILATGSIPVEIPGMEFDGEKVISSTEALQLKKIPDHLIIIGAGVIGLEMGSVYSRLGSKVSLVDTLPGLLISADKNISQLAQRTLAKKGLEFYLGHTVEKLEKTGNGIVVSIRDASGSEKKLEGDIALVSVGRKPFVEGLNLEKIGIAMEGTRVKVNDHTFQTSVENIYAIGDIIRGPMLAHKAEEEGVAVSEIIAGNKGEVNYDAIASVVYVWPEIAWVGKSEEDLKTAGIEYKVGKSFFKANARAKAMNETDGMVKILADKNTDRVLGVHIFAARASDLIAEASIVMEFHGSSEDIARSVHAHPTLSEVIKEAAMAVDGWAIHA